jgi:response regulator RpfG family c-di-GMP phosphodiesterase
MTKLSPSRPNVLLVDDDPSNLIALDALLDSPLYRLVHCYSGAEALKLLLEGDYCLVIMDILMPGLNGFETATLIKSREKSQFLPIIFISSAIQDENFSYKAYESGGVDFITHPFQSQALKKKVEFFASYSKRITREQPGIDTAEVFNELINPLRAILLNVQLMKRISAKKNQFTQTIYAKKLDDLENSTHKLRGLLMAYKDRKA